MFSINELKKLKLTFWNLEMLIFSLISLPTRELRRLMKSRYIFDLSLFGFSPVTRAVAVVSCMVVTLNKRLVSHQCIALKFKMNTIELKKALNAPKRPPMSLKKSRIEQATLETFVRSQSSIIDTLVEILGFLVPNRRPIDYAGSSKYSKVSWTSADKKPSL